MIAIEIDASALDRVTGALDEVAQVIKDEIAAQLVFVQAQWAAAVQGEMIPGMSRPLRSESYLASITDAASLEYPFDGDAFSGRVLSTQPELAWRVENGYPSFDMKPGLLSGPKAKYGKQGRYTTIPFTHTGEGTAGAKGTPMPGNIARMARQLPYGGRLIGTGNQGIRSKVPLLYNWSRAPGTAPLMAAGYTWRSGPYEGMVKTGRARHTSYVTFRRVSDASDPSSWIHPGVPPNPIMRAVRDVCEAPVQEAILARVREVLDRVS